jgi:NAD(P)H-hydrate epimerase
MTSQRVLVDAPLPTADPALDAEDLTLEMLADHWADRARLRPMTAEQMRGADARAQRLGIPGHRLMEEAGSAVGAAAAALMNTAERPRAGVVLVLVGPGNNGGDGLVAARWLAQRGYRPAVVLVSSDERPGTPDARRNWDRLDSVPSVERIHAATARDVAMLRNGIEKAALIVDSLLGTGVQGTLREPIRSAVELALRAREAGVPVLAVDTPTALDLTSGSPSDPTVRADATITFHRPKEGLLARQGKALAGRVLVAPIGIPAAADPQ